MSLIGGIVSGFMGAGKPAANSSSAGDTLSSAGTGSTTNAINNSLDPSASQVFGKTLQDFGNKMQSDSNKRASEPGSSYNAMFGSSNTIPQQQTITQNPAATAPPLPTTLPVQQMQPRPPIMQQPSLPTPMQLPPQIPQMLQMSDVRAKTKIENSTAELDNFLERVYNNAVMKRK